MIVSNTQWLDPMSLYRGLTVQTN